MSSIRVAGFAIDDVTEEKFWHHGIVVEQVLAVIDNPWIMVPNRKGRAATYLMIGRDDSGRCIAIPITATDDPLI